MIVDELIAILGYDVRGTDKLRSFNRSMDALERKGAAVARVMGKFAMVAGAAAVAGGTALVRAGLQSVDAQAKLAQSLGTTVESIQVLERAGELAGVAMSGIEQATKDLTRRLSQAATGTGPAADALERLGLSAETLMAMPLDERVSAINDAIARFVPEAERAAVAGQLFGEEGSIAMARVDSATIRQATQDIQNFGVAVSDQDADQIERTNDALSRLGLIWRGLSNQLAVAAAPALEYFADAMAVLGRSIGAQDGAARRFIEGFGDGFERTVQRVTGHVETLIGLFNSGDLGAALDKWAIPLLLLGVRLFPITSIIAGLALAIDDFLTWLGGGESYIGDFIDALAEFLGTTPEKVTEALKDMANAAALVAGAGLGLLLFIGPLRSLSNLLKGAAWLATGAAALAGFGVDVKAADLGGKTRGVEKMAAALTTLKGALSWFIRKAAAGGGLLALIFAALNPTKMGDGTIPEDMDPSDPRLSMTQEEADAMTRESNARADEARFNTLRTKDFGTRTLSAPSAGQSPQGLADDIASRVSQALPQDIDTSAAISSIENYLANLSAQGDVSATVNDARQDNRQFPVTVNSTVNQTINGVQNAAPDALRATGNAINQGTEQAARINSAAGAAP